MPRDEGPLSTPVADLDGALRLAGASRRNPKNWARFSRAMPNFARRSRSLIFPVRDYSLRCSAVPCWHASSPRAAARARVRAGVLLARPRACVSPPRPSHPLDWRSSFSRARARVSPSLAGLGFRLPSSRTCCVRPSTPPRGRDLPLTGYAPGAVPAQLPQGISPNRPLSTLKSHSAIAGGEQLFLPLSRHCSTAAHTDELGNERPADRETPAIGKPTTVG
jgi:hypothetical protein